MKRYQVKLNDKERAKLQKLISSRRCIAFLRKPTPPLCVRWRRFFDVYKRLYDPKRPQVCMDKMPKQLLADKYDPLPSRPGQDFK